MERLKRAARWLAAIVMLGLTAGCGEPMPEDSQETLQERPSEFESNVRAQACEDNIACLCSRACNQSCGQTNPTCWDECFQNCVN